MTDSDCVVDVPAREAGAVLVAAGERVRVTDPCGGQVGDLFAFVAGDPGEYLSAGHTRSVLSRMWPRPGQAFVTTRRRPLLIAIADDSPGRRDLLIPACDPARYEALGAPGHASCAQNLQRALAVRGLPPAEVVPQPVNLFMDVRPEAGGDLSWHPASTRAGDSVTFEAVRDCLVIVSACPQDLAPVNAGQPTGLSLTLHTPGTTPAPASGSGRAPATASGGRPAGAGPPTGLPAPATPDTGTGTRTDRTL